MKYLLTLFLSFFISLFFVGSVVTAPSYVYQKSIYPLTDNTYTLGTTTLNWMNIYTKQLCLNGDCKTSWPTGGSGSGTTTLNNTFVGFGNSDNTVTGTPTFTFNSTTGQLSAPNISVSGYVTSSNGFYTSSTLTINNHNDYLQQIYKTDDTYGDYTITQRSFPNSGSSRSNQSLRIGFNKGSGGSPLNSLSPSMGIDFESYFLPTTTDPVFEFHVPSIVDQNEEIRPISVLYHYRISSTTPGTAEVSFDSERVNFNNSSGTQYTLLTPENLYLVSNGIQQNTNNINWFRQKNAAGNSTVEIARVNDQDTVVLAPSGNAVYAPGNISTSGTLYADDNFKQYVYTQAVTTTVNGAQAFTQITNSAFSANVEIWLTIHSAGFAQSKRYFLPLSYNGTSGAWRKLLPISTTGAYSSNNAEIDVNINNEIAIFRLRRQAGTTEGNAYITFTVGSDIENSSVTTVTTTYTGATVAGNYLPTSISQYNGFTGINNDSPSTYLHILGTTEQLRTGYDTSNYLSITTGSTGTTTLVATGGSPIISIPGTDARTGQYNLLRIGNATQNFSGANDANSAYLIEQWGVGYNINGSGIVSYPGLRFGFQKEGSWNKSSDPSSGVSGAFVIQTSSGGDGSSLPTISEKFRVSGRGFVGIGTSTPIAMISLTASTTAAGGIFFGETGLYRSSTGTLTLSNALILTSGTSTNFFSTGLTFTNLSGTNATTTNFRASGSISLANTTSTNLGVTGLTNLAGLTFTNATGTGQLRIATTTVTGGFFQTGFTDCTANSSTLQYNATTGKFSCLNQPSVSYLRIVTTTGSTTWTKPTSTRFSGAYVWCVGGGGGGGGAGTVSTIGGGGSGGGASFRILTSSDLSSTSSVNVTVGTGGTGGSAGDNAGTAGGTSSFGNFITCTGGPGGASGGSGTSGSAGGVGSGGNINGTGRAGGAAGAYTDSWRGYGAGAGSNQGDPTTIQDNIVLPWTPGGILGQYAGAGTPRPPNWDANSYTGGTGAYFGGGGGGGQKAGAGASTAGGNGRQGVVVIQELYQ